MGEQIIPIPAPVKGLVDGWSFSAQPEGSAREFQNMRQQDCTNGRMRLSQRAGLSKYCAASLDTPGTKAVGLATFMVDNRQVTYAAAASETVTWQKKTPGQGTCRNVKIDRQGNRYALSGNSGVVKFSADGEEVWQLAIPVTDTNHVIRALCVTAEDLVIVGVSEGGEQKTAKLFCYEQLPDNKTGKLWEISTEAYIEDCLVSQSKLYTCQNRVDRKKSYVRIYEFITGPNPALATQWRCPHPVNSIAVNKSGAVFIAAEATTGDTLLYWRDPDPKFPESRPDSVDWTIERLTDVQKRLWAHLRGDSIDDTDVVSDLEDGVGIFRWRDDSEALRHVISTLGDGQAVLDEPPILAKDAYLEHQGVRFNVGNEDGPYQALRSLPNASISTTFADQQRTLLPAYGGTVAGAATNSGFALFIVCRPSQSAPDAAATPRWLIGQDRDNASSSSDFHQVFLNASSAGDNTLPPTASAGRIFWYTGEATLSGGDGGTVTDQILEGRFDIRNDNGTNADGTTTNKGQITLITMICDGRVTGTSTDAQKSFFRVNGSPIDAFQSRAQATLHASFIGIYRETIEASGPNPSNTVKNLLGDVLEVVVLDRKSRGTDTDAIVTCDDLEASSLAASQTINDVTVIEGALMHKYGAQENLPYGTPAVNNYPHPFGITGSGQDRLSGPPNQAGTAVSGAQALANKAWAAVVKYSSEGKIQWCANEMELVSGNRTGGFGYAVAVNSDGNIYSIGPEASGTGSDDNATIRMIIDQGADFSLQVADGAWSSTAGTQYAGNKWPRIDVDEFDNVYFPSGTSAAGFRVFDKTGAELHHYTGVSSTGCYAIAADKRIPDYRNDITPKRAEFVVMGTSQVADGDDNVFNVRLVDSTQASGSPRSLYTLGVSGGDIVRFATSGVTSITGGSSALDSSARYVQAATLFKKAYWTDGKTYRVYEPITNAVTQFKAKTGSLPPKCALVEQWRGRLFFAHSADEPHNWFAAAKDDPTNFDYFPPVPTEIQAVAGNASTAGLCPDIINSVVPYDEDVLLLGGDHSIWAMDGDPAAGGRLVLVSDITGMAFGRPWCKDPNGVLYFVGSRGGLFRWVPGAKPERISTLRIERALQDIDFGTYHVKLAWNYQDEGIHILVLPFGAGGETVAHHFFEAKPDAFAKDVFGTATHTNVQPTDVLVIDGDEFADRVMVFGCEDGFIRKWDSAARSDDTQTDGSTKIPIDSFVTLFPLPGIEQQAGLETQFSGLTVVLGDRDSGCRYELFASDEPDSFGVAVAQGVLGPGRNPPSWRKVTGAYCGLRLRNAAAEERWSMERAYIHASPAGLARPRLVN